MVAKEMPFSMQLHNRVTPSHDIATGRAASQETQEYLTGILVSCHKPHAKFQEECAADEER